MPDALQVRRLRPPLRHLFEPVAPPPDSPQPRQPARQAVSALSQGLREHASAGNARSHARPQVPLHRLRQGLLASVAAARASALAYRRETIRMRPLREGVRRPAEPQTTHADPLNAQTLSVPPLRQVVCAEILSQQPSRTRLRAGLDGDGGPAADWDCMAAVRPTMTQGQINPTINDRRRLAKSTTAFCNMCDVL